jgi:hypothetical protein
MPPTPSPTSTSTYERLRDYIAKRMRMSHVYQPLMLREVLGRRSPASSARWSPAAGCCWKTNGRCA